MAWLITFWGRMDDETGRAVARIEAKLDRMDTDQRKLLVELTQEIGDGESLSERVNEISHHIQTIESRIEKLERWRTFIHGAWAAVCGVVAAIAAHWPKIFGGR